MATVRVAFLAVAPLALLLTACSGGAPIATVAPVPSPTASTPRPPDPDAAELVGVARLALHKAASIVPDAVLRQVDVAPATRSVVFRFTDAAATEELTLTSLSPDLPPDQWEVNRGISPLVGNHEPGIDLRAWRVGPGAVSRAAQVQWPGCGVTGLTLFGSNGNLAWTVFCELPGGIVSGTLNNTTGVFKASAAPPAVKVPTATPVPSGSRTPSPTPAPATPTPTSTPRPFPSPQPSTLIPTATPRPTTTPTPAGPAVTVGSAIFNVDLAITEDEKEGGLAGRDNLSRSAGMVFLYAREDLYSFWMKGMRFPLDFVWITGDCTVLEVTANVPPPAPGTPDSRLPIYLPSRPVLHMLEINGGEAAQRGIRPGDRVRFSGAALAGYHC